MQAGNSLKRLKMNKTELRIFFKNYSVNTAQKIKEEEHLLQLLWELIQVHNPTCVGLYASIEQEIDLTSIFNQCLKQNIKVAYPRIAYNQLIFHEVTSQKTSFDLADVPQLDRGIQLSYQNRLMPGSYGIPEPPATAPIIQPDFIVMPGFAFTKEGKRLGRGKGYYDKYLSTHHPYTASLAFSWQLLADLPTEPHDISIKKILFYEC